MLIFCVFVSFCRLIFAIVSFKTENLHKKCVAKMDATFLTTPYGASSPKNNTVRLLLIVRSINMVGGICVFYVNLVGWVDAKKS